MVAGFLLALPLGRWQSYRMFCADMTCDKLEYVLRPCTAVKAALFCLDDTKVAEAHIQPKQILDKQVSPQVKSPP
jgi:hypothetical protein